MDFIIPVGHWVKITEREKMNKSLDIVRELKTSEEYACDGDTSCNWCTWNGSQMIEKGTGAVGNRRKNWLYLDYNIVEIGQNSKKSFRDLKGLAITQVPVKAHQITLVRKTQKKKKKKERIQKDRQYLDLVRELKSYETWR